AAGVFVSVEVQLAADHRRRFGPVRDDAFAAVLLDLGGVGPRRHYRPTDLGPPVQVLLAHLRDRHRELPAQFGHDRTDQRTLLFERVDVTEEDVQCQRPNVQVITRGLCEPSKEGPRPCADRGPSRIRAPREPGVSPAADQSRGFSFISYVSMTSSTLRSL